MTEKQIQKLCKKHNTSWKTILGFIVFLLGALSMVFALIMQMILCYEKYGVILRLVFIPHWSNLFFLGIIPMELSQFIFSYKE